MEVLLTSINMRLRLVIDDMRLMPHPAKEWEIEHKHGWIRCLESQNASKDLVKEALAELDALSAKHPAKPYERFELKQREVVVAGG
jgi:hypothetical protein